MSTTTLAADTLVQAVNNNYNGSVEAAFAEIAAAPDYDVYAIRGDFPLLAQQVYGKPLVYLDNAATTQKPQAVLDAIDSYYRDDNANIHRGVYQLSIRATEHYEAARVKVQKFLNARESAEIIYVRSATEGVNLVAATYGRRHVGEGDEIIITAMEHHCNIVPWQMLCEEKGAKLRVVPMNDRGELMPGAFEALLNERTKFVSLSQMSNALGTVNPVKEMVALARARGIATLVDGAQAAYHMPVDVQELGCDFYVFSGHKLYGPTGIGILYGRRELLDAMPPYQGGGDMIKSVTFEKTLYNDLPYKFEAGTPHIDGGIGLGAAIDYLLGLGMDRVGAHESALLDYATDQLSQVDGLRIIGTAAHKASVISFVLGDIHPHDIGTILDQEAIAVRTGHHCAQPVMNHFCIPATARASLACYNTREDIDALVLALDKVKEMFG